MAERQVQGLSLGDVARQLKLSVRQVVALEHDDYGAFPGPVFVRGFLRNYAKMLGLDAEELVAQTGVTIPEINITAPSTGPTVPVPLPVSASSRRTRSGLGATVGIVVLIALVAAAVYEGYRRGQPASVPAAVGLPAERSADVGSASGSDFASPLEGLGAEPGWEVPAAATSPDPVTTPPVPAGTVTDGSALAGLTTAAQSSATIAPSSAVAPSGGLAEVRLNFNDNAWVEIKDEAGKVLLSELRTAGTEQVVMGSPPLTVVIGNAHAVRLTFRGELVDLAPYTRVDVARLTLE
jgi:cytoskeleton protein RodZ